MKLFYGPIWAGRVVLLLFYYKRELAIGVLWSLAQCECVGVCVCDCKHKGENE